MEINIPRPVRAALYILTAIGTPFVAYLLTIGAIGPNEVTLWSAEVVVVSGIAAFNLTPKSKE